MYRSQKLNMLSSSNFQPIPQSHGMDGTVHGVLTCPTQWLFLMSTKSYLKFRTIRGTAQKWVGFGKPLLVAKLGLILKDQAFLAAYVLYSFSHCSLFPDLYTCTYESFAGCKIILRYTLDTSLSLKRVSVWVWLSVGFVVLG